MLYKRLVLPLLLAALNIDPPDGSAGLAGAIIRETLLAGGQACRPLIARDGLSSVLIEPAIDYIRARGGSVDIGHEVRQHHHGDDRVTALSLGDQTIALGPDDAVVMAVPPRSAAALVPGLTAPTKFRAIVNAHFRFVPPPHLPPMIGVVNGLIEWLFAFPERLSITISGGDRLVDMPREELARAIWKDICVVAGIEAEMPPWQIVRERRATFEASPEQNALRPGALTAWKNLFLAGDWTDTGLPATIEGSVRSGNRAADHVLKARCNLTTSVAMSSDERHRPRRSMMPRSEDRIGAATRGAAGPSAAGRTFCVRARGRCDDPVRIRPAAALSRRAGRRALEAKIAAYLRRIQGAHGGWPLLHDGTST